MVALIAGSTGLVGGFLLKQLVDSNQYTEIVSLVRKPGNKPNHKVKELVINFDQLSDIEGLKDHIDVVFCCLGTTMKQAGSKSEFFKVDYEYVLELGKLAKIKNAHTFVLNSALGADKNSVFYYNRVKGQIEAALGELNFPNLIIVRPSLLLGKRIKERLGEKIGAFLFKFFSFIFIGSLKKYKAVSAENVAKSMFKASLKKGNLIIESDFIDQ